MYVERHVVSVTTNASGDATVYTSEPVNGEILAIRYVPHATTPLDTGAGITVTGEESGTPVITITNLGTSAVSYAPRQATHSTAGAAALYAAAGTAVNDRIAIAKERIKLVVAQGGNVLSGTFHIVTS